MGRLGPHPPADEQTPVAPPPPLHCRPRWRSVSLRHGDWRLITHGIGEKHRLELFNVAAESDNLADRYPDCVRELHSHLEKAASTDRDSVVD